MEEEGLQNDRTPCSHRGHRAAGSLADPHALEVVRNGATLQGVFEDRNCF